MPSRSRWSLDIPNLSLSSYLFTSPDATLPDTPVLLDADRPDFHLSLHSYREWSKRLAAGLRQHGFAPGDRLLLFAGNSVFFPVIFQATVMAAGIFTAANPAYVARELAHQLTDSAATFLIAAEGTLDTALEAAATVSHPRSRIFQIGSGLEVFDGGARAVKGVPHWTSLLASEHDGAAFAWDELSTRAAVERTCVINYSSGTTGLPKGVEISHRNYVSNAMQTEYVSRLAADYDARLARAVALNFIPMYHAYGQTYHAVKCPKNGTPVYIMRKFDFLAMLAHVARYRVTSLNLVPPIAVAMTKRPETRDFDLSSLESAGCGAAPLSAETIADFDALVHHRFHLTQGWGMTEMTCTATGWHPDATADPAKVGELLVNVEGMIVDDHGNELPADQRGEFWVRGPNIMKGYWRNPAATRDTITPDGWLKTGDIAVRDENGHYAIVDRKKELIKVKGNQVAPAELEGVLLEHPSVVDAAVVGVKIKSEELPRAYVVLSPTDSTTTTTTTPDAIAAWIASRVARHKRLQGGVAVVDAIPKNPSGKILRKIVREWAAADAGAGVGGRESKL